ncbi:MAG: Bifunctional folylpolyglutamate synthase/dihydrofolate synthase, partial [Dehalococcoidia bacterium]|nr:Bifunctional folylpolyglutamate synthase/dihydrofolate synthase [Dehalococcoidia bacterium]
MDYKAALDYIYSLTNYEIAPATSYSSANYDLRRMDALLSALGNPHLGPITLHIAGTKGKGSTAAMVASALSNSGYRTGLYTSPHLHTIRERIRVDGELISEADLADLTDRLKPKVEEINSAATFGMITTFELLTALAFCYFQERQVKCQVLEVGLGGRLDATNVVRPDVCIITPISLDHTDILGDTVGQIAREKAGIIKPGARVVVAPQPSEAEEVIIQACEKAGATGLLVEREVTWQRECADLQGQCLTVKGRKGSYSFKVPLLGRHQGENAATAIAALELLMERLNGITPDSVARGLTRVEWPGRMQVLKEDPLWIVDGAHNPASARVLRAALEEDFPTTRPIFIIGTSSDKD